MQSFYTDCDNLWLQLPETTCDDEQRVTWFTWGYLVLLAATARGYSGLHEATCADKLPWDSRVCNIWEYLGLLGVS